MDRRLELNFWSRLGHHFLTIFLTILGLMFLYFSINQPTDDPLAVSPINLLITAAVLFGLSTLTYFWLENKLKFAVIETKLDYLTLTEVILKTAKTNEWIPTRDFSPPDKRLEFITSRPFGTQNKIMIDLDDKHVFVNARGNYPTDEKIVEKIRTALTMKGHEIEYKKSRV